LVDSTRLNHFLLYQKQGETLQLQKFQIQKYSEELGSQPAEKKSSMKE
jgi:hypothetical protein